MRKTSGVLFLARDRVARYLSLVRFSHTLFALPFALMSYLVATQGKIKLGNSALFLMAMVAARTAALTYNRIVDRHIDAANPRTASRELVTGAVRLSEAVGLLIVSCLLFVLVAYLLNPLAFALSPLALVVLLGYSYTKRFTSLSHFFLGLALGIAPVGAWIAATATIHLAPVLLGVGVLFWVSGFDIMYACQDAQHDSSLGLYSLPLRLGLRRALALSALLHTLCLPFLAAFAILHNLGVPFYIGLAIAALCLAYQHAIVSPRDLSRVKHAALTTNAFLSIALLVFLALDIYA
jgi:4-hydroxybenzoate polyprenyltransferase